MPESRGRWPKSKPEVKRAHDKAVRRAWNRKKRDEYKRLGKRRAAARNRSIMEDAKMSTEQLLERAKAKAGLGKKSTKGLMSKLDRLFNRGG